MAPLLEETFFRSWLGHVRGILMIMPTVLTIGAILAIILKGAAIMHLALPACVLVLGAFIIYMRRYDKTQNIEGRHESAAQNIFPFLFWGIAIVFALVHLLNYAEARFQFHMILLVTPQFIAGVILGFVRMRYGFWAAVVLHSAHYGLAMAWYFFA